MALPVNENGQPADLVMIPRELLQQIVDYLGTCPAGQVYPMLRRLEDELAEPIQTGE